MDYKLARELKDAGFPQPMGKVVLKGEYLYACPKCFKSASYSPTLPELIDECNKIFGEGFYTLTYSKDQTGGDWNLNYWDSEDLNKLGFSSDDFDKWEFRSDSPKESFAKLYLKLNKK